MTNHIINTMTLCALLLSAPSFVFAANSESTKSAKLSKSKLSTSANSKNEWLVKVKPGMTLNFSTLSAIAKSEPQAEDLKIEDLKFDGWIKIKSSGQVFSSLSLDPAVEYIQPNFKVKLIEDYQIQDPLKRAAILKLMAKENTMRPPIRPDNPPIPAAPGDSKGIDPLFQKQWGMLDIKASEAWKKTKGNQDLVVAVIDTGVDYTHEDLLPNMWRNPGEAGTDNTGKDKANNGIDDDKNGYIDDIFGWDYVSNDNKPFDLAADPMDLISKGGNPGHGTHCAGNVAARSENGKGIAGVAPHVKIMAIRFLGDAGGTTEDAVKSIKYAVDNGAKVLSNSWGSEGEDPNDEVNNKALRDVIQYAQDKGVLFIAAAGNGHNGVGYSNDSDKNPAYPASYEHENIISVAALDIEDHLGSFSNWGSKSVDIGAPGVRVFSTTVGSNYSDTVFDKFGMTIGWDGTSMATPHVAGAAALYWSLHPNKNWQEVKDAILKSSKKIPALTNKAVSEGKLDVESLLNR